MSCTRTGIEFQCASALHHTSHFISPSTHWQQQLQDPDVEEGAHKDGELDVELDGGAGEVLDEQKGNTRVA